MMRATPASNSPEAPAHRLPSSPGHGAGDGAVDGLDPAWVLKRRVWSNRTTRGALTPKLVALIGVLLNTSLTHFDAAAARRAMLAARATGASRREILAVLKLATSVGIHSYATAAPAVRAAALATDTALSTRTAAPLHVLSALRAAGQFNPAWEDIAAWDPEWLDAFAAVGISAWTDGVLDIKSVELHCIAGDASVNHLWSSGVQRHAEAALRAGAAIDEILEVLRIVSLQGLDSLDRGLAILATLEQAEQ